MYVGATALRPASSAAGQRNLAVMMSDCDGEVTVRVSGDSPFSNRTDLGVNLLL